MHEDEPHTHEERVEAIQIILGGWIQNLARSATGEGWTLEPEVVVDAICNLKKEYEQLVADTIDNLDWSTLDRWIDEDEGRGTQ